MSSRARQPEGAEIAREQKHLTMLHQQLDARRERARSELGEVLRERGGAGQARLERAAAASRLAGLVASYDAAEHGLCFGRLDLADGGTRYLGRIGLRADDPDAEPLLIDWRAPIARAFYTATAAAPQGVKLRRHLHTRGRQVVRVDDELLDDRGELDGEVKLIGEAALLAALRAERTGRMRDAVATLQAEQDRIIRSPGTGVLVVQGGPGTGKTVVALHRAAYLLYSHPRLNERGVLVVGPNPVFLSYVGAVLPGLGETNALLATVGELFPGVVADAVEPDAVTEVKGRLVMADVVAAAVRAHQGVAAGPVSVDAGGERLRLTPSVIEAAARRARASGLPHNLARAVFGRAVVRELAGQLARVTPDLMAAYEAELADTVDQAALDRAVAADLANLLGGAVPEPEAEASAAAEAETDAVERAWVASLWQEPAVRRLLDSLWPSLTPHQLLTALYTRPDLLAQAAPELTEAERDLLRRPPTSGWSVADVPLLDEAAELLGQDDRAERASRDRERAALQEYARGVFDIAHGSRAGEDDDAAASERLSIADVLTAERLADWQQEADTRTVAERAAADRTWAFGHVIVDEAQELSPMAWRLLTRRCPTRSFTVVGDMAQASEASGATSWAQALAPFFGDRWRLESLTVNYRTPATIMAAADQVLAALRAGLPAQELPQARAVRPGQARPWRRRVSAAELPAAVAELAAAEAAEVGTGRVAVIAPEAAVATLAEAVAAQVADSDAGARVDLERRVVTLTVRQSKGLEFDSVLVVEPARLLAGSVRGLGDLYVALTRASARLGVVHTGPPPPLLAHLDAA